jgi:hypothetical protein
MQSSLEGNDVPFLSASSFLTELKSLIATRSANSASLFSINALIPAASVAAGDPSCAPQDLVPFLAKIVRWILGPSGIVLRVGPGLLVCVHISHRSVDPELIGLQVERSIKRIFKIPAETAGILKMSFRFDPAVAESEATLNHFLSSL